MSNNAQALASILEDARAECMAKYKLGDDLSQKCVLDMALDLTPDVFRFEAARQTNDAQGVLSELSSFLIHSDW